MTAQKNTNTHIVRYTNNTETESREMDTLNMLRHIAPDSQNMTVQRRSLGIVTMLIHLDSSGNCSIGWSHGNKEMNKQRVVGQIESLLLQMLVDSFILQERI